MKAAEVITSVRRHYGAEHDGLGPEWAALEEFSLATGAGHRRADLFLVRAWPGRPKGHERHAVEVKVSRADLLSELANPTKAYCFEQVAHRFYLATPHGLVKDTDPVPAHWGLYTISAGGRCMKVREATKRAAPDPMPEGALVEAFRRAARAEARIRGADSNDAAARVVEQDRQLAAAARSLTSARRAADRDHGDLRSLLAQISLAGGWLCVCGVKLKKTKWEVKHHDATPCPRSSYGAAEIDLEGLAIRLGINSPSLTSTGRAEYREHLHEEPDAATG